MKKEEGGYLFESNDVRVVLHAKNRLMAWRLFWQEVREHGWGGSLGIIVIMKSPTWKTEDDSVAGKTYPMLWNLKLVPWDTLVESLALHIYDGDKGEAARALAKYAVEDAWQIPAQAVDLEHDWKGRRLN